MVSSLRKVQQNSSSVAYSDSASGVYRSKILFPRMQLGKQFEAKAHMIPAEPVGEVIARGQAQIGFQQLSELKRRQVTAAYLALRQQHLVSRGLIAML